jgi:hypothetical protein
MNIILCGFYLFQPTGVRWWRFLGIMIIQTCSGSRLAIDETSRRLPIAKSLRVFMIFSSDNGALPQFAGSYRRKRNPLGG